MYTYSHSIVAYINEMTGHSATSSILQAKKMELVFKFTVCLFAVAGISLGRSIKTLSRMVVLTMILASV